METSNYKSIVLLIIFLLLTQLSFSQNNVIPWIPLEKNEIQRNTEVITIDQVGIPAYPGSYLTAYYPASSSNQSEETLTSMATIYLVTSDEIDKVQKFYKEALKLSEGWKQFDEYKVFVKGDLQEALSRTVPGVAIREETGESFDLAGAEPKILTTIKTRIKILFKP